MVFLFNFNENIISIFLFPIHFIHSLYFITQSLPTTKIRVTVSWGKAYFGQLFSISDILALHTFSCQQEHQTVLTFPLEGRRTFILMRKMANWVYHRNLDIIMLLDIDLCRELSGFVVLITCHQTKYCHEIEHY